MFPNKENSNMKKIILSFVALVSLCSMASAQVFVNKPKSNEVSVRTHEYRLTATSFEVQWLGDGRNIRGAFNIGTGLPVTRLVANLPSFFDNFRVVPFVTVDTSESGSNPRSTVALLAPQWNFSPNVGVQFGAALRGLDARNDWRPVHGVDPYVRLSFYFK